MTTDLFTVTPDTEIVTAIEILAEKQIGSIPVVDDDGRFVGLLEDDDIIMEDARVHEPVYVNTLLAFVKWPGTGERLEREMRKIAAVTVGDAMKPLERVTTLGPDDTLEDVATIMIDRRIFRIPVVEGDRCLGMVTRHDVIGVLAREGA